MTNDSLARELSAGGEPSDQIYDALVTLLSANARGRAFLEEHARRARAADTRAALTALARIEALLSKTTDNEPSAQRVESGMPARREAASARSPTPSVDLLLQVMALTPEERIALFS
jgi:hypothetical protein